jgi:uncharacterized membrane protein YgcG
MQTGLIQLTVAMLVLAAPAAVAQDSDERILRFHSDITVAADASMEVRETIQVRAAGDRIRRGIYRDFPTRYRDRLGNLVTVTFDVVQVLRDGRNEPWRTESISNGVRVYAGSENVFLDPGEYTYTFVYRTTRQLGFFDDHDELYWNVTGNGWEFALDDASATIQLPPGIEVADIQTIGFTGAQGSTEQAYEAAVEVGPAIQVRATRALGPAEGLTVAVAWPKGFVAEPSRQQRLGYFVSDNLSSVVALVGLLGIVGYYLVTWVRVGRDPAAGAIVARYDPPASMSPAAMRYLVRMGWDDRVLSAALIDMAVKGYLTITQDDDSFTLKRVGPPKALSPEEKVVADKLFATGERLEVGKKHGSIVKAAHDGLKARLKMSLQKIYFITNRRYLWPGIALSVLVLVGVALTPPGPDKVATIFLCVWLAGWSTGVVVLGYATWQAWKAALAGGLGGVGTALFVTLFSLPFFGGELVGLWAFFEMTSYVVLAALLAIIAVNLVAHHLLKAPTRAGRAMLDQIEGFKLFLSAVEQHRWEVLHPPDRTPELFEKYLPYALALDIEQRWSEQFADVLSATGQESEYTPSWYHGTSFDVSRASTFAASVGSAMSAAVAASAARSSGSSSGFSGGGSSGGGGGGGGGGGW